MLNLELACDYCFQVVSPGHVYQCPSLHERILTIGKRGRLHQPLDPLTHDALVEGCNCKRCIERISP